MTLNYNLEVLEAHPKLDATPLTLKMSDAKEVVFDGLGMKAEADTMQIEVELSAFVSNNEQGEEARLERVDVVAPEGALMTFPSSFLSAIRDREEAKAGNSFHAKSGGRTVLSFKRAPDKATQAHPLRLRMVGGVQLNEQVPEHAPIEVMRAATLELEATLHQGQANQRQRSALQRLLLNQKARAAINEVRASGEKIEINLSVANQRSIVIAINPELEVSPALATGRVRLRDLKRVRLHAQREIRILETRDSESKRQESALSAFEEAEAEFQMEDDSRFGLRGSTVHFTLERPLDAIDDEGSVRYSLRNILDFECSGSGVRPRLTWFVGEVRRVALFSERLSATRGSADSFTAAASGGAVRALVVPSEDRRGIGAFVALHAPLASQLVLRSEGTIFLDMPMALLDPDDTDTSAQSLALSIDDQARYEETLDDGTSVNLIRAARLSLDLLFGERKEDSSRRRVERVSLEVEGQ
ncbi:MAG: hypothetical protein KDB07_13425, partial [Planctomycetes bacterium]|nr:hypothetical protein [Planctomycetota bacterium]